MRRSVLILASLSLLAACAGERPVGPPVDSAVSIADQTGAIDRGLLVGRWSCAQANAPGSAPVPGYSLDYAMDGTGRSVAETPGGPPGSVLAEARLIVETRWLWGTLDDRIEQSGMASTARPADGSEISAVAARVAQVTLDSLAADGRLVTRLEVLRLDRSSLVLRPEGRPQVVACSRLG